MKSSRRSLVFNVALVAAVAGVSILGAPPALSCRASFTLAEIDAALARSTLPASDLARARKLRAEGAAHVSAGEREAGWKAYQQLIDLLGLRRSRAGGYRC
jgi:hypothetical protein